jgi:hypothetical protein
MSAPLFTDAESVAFELHRLASCSIRPLTADPLLDRRSDDLPGVDLSDEERHSICALVLEADAALTLAADIAARKAAPLSADAQDALYVVTIVIENDSRGGEMPDASGLTADELRAAHAVLDATARPRA